MKNTRFTISLDYHSYVKMISLIKMAEDDGRNISRSDLFAQLLERATYSFKKHQFMEADEL